jgi:hypothetical protein
VGAYEYLKILLCNICYEARNRDTPPHDQIRRRIFGTGQDTDFRGL